MLSKKGGHRKCDTRLLLVRGCGDFVRVVPTFLTIARVLVLGYLLADHAGFCTWFYAGFCNVFGGILGLTTARRPFGGLF